MYVDIETSKKYGKKNRSMTTSFLKASIFNSLRNFFKLKKKKKKLRKNTY